MRVLHITNAYPYPEYSSYGIFIKEQIDSLNDQGIKNYVFFINAKKNGVTEYFSRKNDLIKVLVDFKPDIIHCHHEFSTILLLLKNIKQPIILSLLGDLNKRSFFNKFIFQISTFKVSQVILKNKRLEKSLYKYLPNGVNFNLFKPLNKLDAKIKLNLDPSFRYVLFVTASLNNPIKRYDKFLSILEKLNEKNLIFYPLILTGVTRDQVPYYFNACDFLLLTSDHEGSPNAVKEAMACNLPVVSTNVGNVKDLFGESMGNFIANSNTVDDLVRLSIKASLINYSEGRTRLKSLGLDINTVAYDIKEIYRNVLK